MSDALRRDSLGTHLPETVAQLGINPAKFHLADGLLKNNAGDSPQALLRVDVEFTDLLHQEREHLWGQLI